MQLLMKLPFLKDVSKEDTHLALILATASAFLLCGYEFSRTSSNALFKNDYGAEHLPLVMGMSPVVLLGLVYIYEKLLIKFGPQKTIYYISVGTALILTIGYVGIQLGFRPASAAMFIFKSGYIVLIIEQYWSFVNSTVAENSAKRLNGPLVGISTIGGAIGGLIVAQVAEPLGAISMGLIAALFMLPCAWLSEYAYQCHGGRVKEEYSHEDKDDSKNRFGIREFKRYPTLIYILLIVLFTQFMAAVLQINFQTIVQQVYPDPNVQTAFLGTFFAKLNGTALVLMFVGAPLLLKYFSSITVQAMIPLVHVITCFALNMSPTLATASIAYILFKSFDYSLFRASKEVLYMPMSFDARYRAKELIDVFGYRFGKGSFSLVITLLQRAGIQMAPYFASIGFAITLIWFLLIFPMKKANMVSLEKKH